MPRSDTLAVLADRTYRRLFLAQVVALSGTGLVTIALALKAHDLAGERAALVLGTVFTLKMAAYVVVAPVAGAFADRVPRRRLLIALDLVRALAALALPFVTELWQVYALVLLLQSASAAFTPIFQATVPDVLTDERRYTRALSLSRLAYELENVLSPALAALLLLLVSSDTLFLGTVAGFAGSAALLASVVLPSPRPTARRRGIRERTTRGVRNYLRTPRLRGLLALNASVAAAGAMVLVNTIVLVREDLGLGESEVAAALGLFGAGSMLSALIVPGLLERVPDRTVMLCGAALASAALALFAVAIGTIGLGWITLLVAWFVTGAGYSTVQTPSGRLLRRSALAEDRPALFAAQFALSHACWLVAYPLAGWLLTRGGPVPASLALGGIAAAGAALAALLWPIDDPEVLEHRHDDLPDDHPHLEGGRAHAHPFVIDDVHARWPTRP